MSLRHRIAGRVRSLRRRYPALPRGEAANHFAALLIQRDVLMEAMLGGTMDDRRWRALSEVSRMLVDLGRSLGVVPAAPRAGQEPTPLDDDDDWRKYMYPQEAES